MRYILFLLQKEKNLKEYHTYLVSFDGENFKIKRYYKGYAEIAIRKCGAICTVCKATFDDCTDIEAHHINGNGNQHDKENLTVLCNYCHSKVHTISRTQNLPNYHKGYDRQYTLLEIEQLYDLASKIKIIEKKPRKQYLMQEEINDLKRKLSKALKDKEVIA